MQICSDLINPLGGQFDNVVIRNDITYHPTKKHLRPKLYRPYPCMGKVLLLLNILK